MSVSLFRRSSHPKIVLRFGFAETPPALSREHTVAVLGSSTKKPNRFVSPFFNAIQQVAGRLSRQGYNIMTGGCSGANYHANLGALPERSYAVHVPGWEIVPNVRPDGQGDLFRSYATVDSGPLRTHLFGRLAKTVLLMPGGVGTLQEVFTLLESMYYKMPNMPDKLVLLGKKFWQPMLEQLIRQGLAEERLRDLYTIVDVKKWTFRPWKRWAAVRKIVRLVTGQSSQTQTA